MGRTRRELHKMVYVMTGEGGKREEEEHNRHNIGEETK